MAQVGRRRNRNDFLTDNFIQILTNKSNNGGVSEESQVSQMRKTIMTVLIVAATGVPLSGCASVFGFGTRTAVVNYQDTKWCVPRKLKRVLRNVSRRYGPVTVHSTKRWWFENWRKGGARNSLHLKCKAVDFSVPGDPNSVIAYLKSQPAVGGYKYYRTGFYHIDTGPRRTW